MAKKEEEDEKEVEIAKRWEKTNNNVEKNLYYVPLA